MQLGCRVLATVGRQPGSCSIFIGRQGPGQVWLVLDLLLKVWLEVHLVGLIVLQQEGELLQLESRWGGWCCPLVVLRRALEWKRRGSCWR